MLAIFPFCPCCHFSASFKSSYVFFLVIRVLSGGPPHSCSMPPWSHVGNLAFKSFSHLGLLYKCPMFLFHTARVPCSYSGPLGVATLVPSPSPLVSSVGLSWSSLRFAHTLTSCHLGGLSLDTRWLLKAKVRWSRRHPGGIEQEH